MSFNIHRKRLACVECTRRKVKCDKILPCRNCTRKGTSCTRPRERDSPNPSSSSQSEARIERPILARPSPDAHSSILVESLQSRVNQLEAALKEATEAAIRPRMSEPDRNFNIDYSFSPVESTVHPSPLSVQDVTRSVAENSPNEVEDAATILEFLAWGRRKDPTYQDEIARQSNMDHSPGDVPADNEWDTTSTAGLSPMALCQALLPVKQKVYQLVNYHCECLLWYHGAFHARTFRMELDEFYRKGEGRIDGSGVDGQWIALLFAVLTGSMSCAPRRIAQSWGFHNREQDSLSKRWLKATIACLYHADYMACHSISSVEAIATLTISAHKLGQSNGFSVLLATAVRIAQGLGLHQLGGEHDVQTSGRLNRELGRRIWCQLCIQDWFSIPFTESYLIHRLGFNTHKPQNCDDEMTALSEDQPTVTSYSRVKYDIAALMPELQDDLISCNTLYTRYEEVLKFDRRLRTLATHLPLYLQNVPLDPSWPCYVPWARRSLAISSAHKVIMIHRKFLSLSFVNPMFEFTRKTCVAASRTIIKEQKEAAHEGGPVMWINQAFSVTASIILCLDMFHQSGPDRQCTEHRQLIKDGIDILSNCESDMIAQRGVSLMKAMLDAENSNFKEMRLAAESRGSVLRDMPRENRINLKAIIRAFYEHDGTSQSGQSKTVPEHSRWSEITLDHTVPGFDMIPLGVDYSDDLGDMLSLATNYLH